MYRELYFKNVINDIVISYIYDDRGISGAIYPYPSTGREPENLNEQIVMKDAMTHSVDDKKIKNTDDPRFPGWLGWAKYSHRDDPSGIEIHYNGNRYFPRWYPFSPWFDFKVKDN